MVQPVDNLSTFFSLPMDAQGPQNDQVVGQDEFGRLIYQGQNGSRYVMTERPRMDMSNALAYAVDNPWETAKGVAGAIVEGAWNGIETPGNALRGETLTYGDVADTALDWGVMGAVGRAPEGSLRIFAGRNAQTADSAALEAAQRMAGEGASRDEIWRNTGWFQGVDGQWRFEIDDSGAGLVEDAFPMTYADDGRGYNHAAMGEAFQHQGPYSAYPGLADADLVRYPWGNAGTRGEYRPATVYSWGDGAPESVTLWDGFGPDNSTILHEMQHAIQHREGFARGGSPANALDLPPNPRHALWQQNQDAVRRAQAYRNSPQYQADLDAINARWNEYWEPQLQALDAERPPRGDAAGLEAFNARADAIFRGAEEESARLFPEAEEFTRVAREFGIDEPSPTLSPRETYRRLAGEVEARNVQTRADFTPEQRRATPPWETQDVPEVDQIVRYGSGPQASIPETPAQSIARLLREDPSQITDDMLGALTPNDNMELARLYDEGATGVPMPMDEASRMARAGEMGFDNVGYHGTPGDFARFNAPDQRNSHGTHIGTIGAANERVEGRLSDFIRGRMEARGEYSPDNVLPLIYRNPNPIEMEDMFSWSPEDLTGRLEYMSDVGEIGPYNVAPRESIHGGKYFDNRDIVGALEDQGRSGFRYTNIVEDAGSVSDAIFDPTNIRSRFARFDPRLRHLANLSAGVAAGGMMLPFVSEEDNALSRLEAYLNQ
jgi:hypothetical protein